MHLFTTVVMILGAWFLLALLVALVTGRFLRAADRLAATGEQRGAGTFDSAA